MLAYNAQSTIHQKLIIRLINQTNIATNTLSQTDQTFVDILRQKHPIDTWSLFTELEMLENIKREQLYHVIPTGDERVGFILMNQIININYYFVNVCIIYLNVRKKLRYIYRRSAMHCI